MIPLRDSTPKNTFPYVTITIIAINMLVFVFELSLGNRGMQSLFYDFGLTPVYFTWRILSPDAYLPFISSLFLHGSWLHLIGNMWTLWLFGDNLEDRMGPGRFTVFYLFCGFLAGLSHVLFNPTSNVPVVGASGAIAGVMGAYLLMFRNARILTFVPPFFIFPLPAWIYMGVWVLTQVWSVLTGNFGSVALWAHIGGFAVGMILFRYFIKQDYLNSPAD